MDYCETSCILKKVKRFLLYNFSVKKIPVINLIIYYYNFLIWEVYRTVQINNFR